MSELDAMVAPGVGHPQVRIAHGELEAEVDAELAPLILNLWRAGIDTKVSCQEHGCGKVWVGFPSVEGAMFFLDIVIPPTPRARDDIWRRATRWGFGWLYSRSVPSGAAEADAWEYHTGVADVSYDESRKRFVLPKAERPTFAFDMHVLFPRRDLAAVTERVCAYVVANPSVEAGQGSAGQ